MATTSNIPEGWSKAPTLAELNQNFEDSKGSHDIAMNERRVSLDILNATGSARKKTRKGFSDVHPQVARKHAEWRYAALSEAFLANQDVYRLKPRTAQDKESAHQNEVLLNYQWNNQIDKVGFVDELVRTGVDEGTAFIRVGWETVAGGMEPKNIYDYFPATSQAQVEELQKAAVVQQSDPYAYKAHVPEHIQEALRLTVQLQKPIYPVFKETIEVEALPLVNQPTLEVCNSANLYIDPLCQGDLDKANFAIYSFETSKADLNLHEHYFDVDKIKVDTGSILNAPDHEVSGDESFNFKDDSRVKFVAYEYWGFWDVDGSGVTTPFVATWVNDTLIRMEENPYPDKKIPFESVQYLPRRKQVYGTADSALLKDNQAIIGAVTRGAIDLMARSANAQKGIRDDLLDTTNLRKYEAGENYTFNPMVSPAQGVIEHSYPEIPNSVSLMLNMQEMDANNMTGVRPFGATDSSAGTATADRGVLDAATKRETGILRRFGRAMQRIGAKMVAMNGEFLSDEEIIRVTDDEFVAIRREELKGNYDVEVTIATAEEDATKAQELSFMLQTLGNTMPFELSQIVLADIARLRKMPQLSERISDFAPQPDPHAEMLKRLEVAKLELELAELQAKTQKLQTSAQLDMAKAGEAGAKTGNIQSDTDQKDLSFLEQQSGVAHARDMEQDQSQARGNMALEILKADLAQETNQPQQVS
ncbi:portal protein [Vibrio phage 1.245.O._10N.261.54.C7]|uniref:Coil containing protein n=1 Tax=Vibrio phage 1.245.O._10N.261.54.C7 TaxID=1881236 RepID=A0A2I7RWC0_9CAUD|nr:portal protein [Vibrio phage 1.245.O._10N.261.54.C7]AUR97947.1 coil containing protein [Vibrio phage 1.245.O._10N.261.54.C7]